MKQFQPHIPFSAYAQKYSIWQYKPYTSSGVHGPWKYFIRQYQPYIYPANQGISFSIFQGMLGILCLVWVSHSSRHIRKIEMIHQGIIMVIRSLKILSFEEKLKDLGFLCLESSRQKGQGNLITVFQYLKGSYRENGGALFTRIYSDKTRGNGQKLFRGYRSEHEKKNSSS